MSKVYTSGQITGLSEAEYTALFDQAESFLTGEEFEVVNPLKVQACAAEDCGNGATKEDGSYLHHYNCYMKHDIKAMLDCDAIVMLPNWQQSQGACFEYQVALKCGMQAFYLNDEMTRIF